MIHVHNLSCRSILLPLAAARAVLLTDPAARALQELWEGLLLTPLLCPALSAPTGIPLGLHKAFSAFWRFPSCSLQGVHGPAPARDRASSGAMDVFVQSPRAAPGALSHSPCLPWAAGSWHWSPGWLQWLQGWGGATEGVTGWSQAAVLSHICLMKRFE